MIGHSKHTVLLLLLFGLASNAHATCWEEASDRYNIPIPLLKAIAEVESSNRARVVAQNTNGSFDYGFMQINDFWLPELARHGIGKAELMDACTSLNVGAWILAQNIRQMGYGWEAVGAYGAGTRKDKAVARIKYARKVWKVLDGITSAQIHHFTAYRPLSSEHAVTKVPSTALRRKRGIQVVSLE